MVKSYNAEKIKQKEKSPQPKTIIQKVEVIKEVPVEVIKTIIKEIPIEKKVEVIKYIPRPEKKKWKVEEWNKHQRVEGLKKRITNLQNELKLLEESSNA